LIIDDATKESRDVAAESHARALARGVGSAGARA